MPPNSISVTGRRAERASLVTVVPGKRFLLTSGYVGAALDKIPPGSTLEVLGGGTFVMSDASYTITKDVHIYSDTVTTIELKAPLLASGTNVDLENVTIDIPNAKDMDYVLTKETAEKIGFEKLAGEELNSIIGITGAKSAPTQWNILGLCRISETGADSRPDEKYIINVGTQEGRKAPSLTSKSGSHLYVNPASNAHKTIKAVDGAFINVAGTMGINMDGDGNPNVEPENDEPTLVVRGGRIEGIGKLFVGGPIKITDSYDHHPTTIQDLVVHVGGSKNACIYLVMGATIREEPALKNLDWTIGFFTAMVTDAAASPAVAKDAIMSVDIIDDGIGVTVADIAVSQGGDYGGTDPNNSITVIDNAQVGYGDKTDVSNRFASLTNITTGLHVGAAFA